MTKKKTYTMRVDSQSHKQVKMLSEVFSKKFGTYISMVDVLRMGISVLHIRLQESIADASIEPKD